MVNAKIVRMRVTRFYSTQQLAWKKTALSFLPSARSMPLFKIEERPLNCGQLTVLEKNFPGFTIGSDPKEYEQVLVPKPHHFYMGDSPSLIDVSNRSTILHTWNLLHKEQKAYINTIFAVIDILVAELGQINLGDIAARRQVAFDSGYKEPSYRDSFEGETKQRRVVT